MAGDWIKMRGALLDHPKVITMSRVLMGSREFRDWLTPGGGGEMNGQIVSDGALRCVTLAALLKVWSVSREHGKFVGCDLILEHSSIPDLDQICGIPCIGEAMESVGWAVEANGVTLPNFIDYNVPLTGAERQSQYRKRALQGVTKPLRESRHISVTREEREKNNKYPPKSPQGDFSFENRVLAEESWLRFRADDQARAAIQIQACCDWTDAEFATAVRAAIARNGRRLSRPKPAATGKQAMDAETRREMIRARLVKAGRKAKRTEEQIEAAVAAAIKEAGL